MARAILLFSVVLSTLLIHFPSSISGCNKCAFQQLVSVVVCFFSSAARYSNFCFPPCFFFPFFFFLFQGEAIWCRLTERSGCEHQHLVAGGCPGSCTRAAPRLGLQRLPLKVKLGEVMPVFMFCYKLHLGPRSLKGWAAFKQ